MKPITCKFRALVPLGALVVAACSNEPEARSTEEFLENPQFLEAAMVRCAQNRSETRYETECMNARAASSIIAAREERERRDRLEAESANKRDALRRTQRAAEEARRRADEQRRLREEAEYLAQFGELPPDATESEPLPHESNAPGAVLPAPEQPASQTRDEIVYQEPVADRPSPSPSPAAEGSNAPAAETEPETDLDAIREELERRNQSDDN
ncbi:MAG: EexN family lipoprotein [Pseudomonadota bacterium]